MVTEDLFVGTVSAKELLVHTVGQYKWIQAVITNDVLIPYKLDTGAEANLLAYQDYLRLKNRPKIKDANIRLKDYNRKEIPCKGKCTVQITLKKKKYFCQFLVVENTQSLIGGDTCDRLNLVRRVYQVKKTSVADVSCDFENVDNMSCDFENVDDMSCEFENVDDRACEFEIVENLSCDLPNVDELSFILPDVDDLPYEMPIVNEMSNQSVLLNDSYIPFSMFESQVLDPEKEKQVKLPINEVKVTKMDNKGKLSQLPFKHSIVLKENAKPVVHAPRRVPVALRSQLKEELQRMEQLGVISSVDEPTDWVNSMVVTKKPNGKLRVCLDPRDLNQNIKREHYQIPKREEIYAEMANACIFSKLDASTAFWQVALDAESSKLTTFNTPYGRRRYNRIPYGLCSAPEVFHKIMEQIMENIDGVRVYLDDTLIWGTTVEEHDRRLAEVMKRVEQYGLLINKEKSEFGVKEITFLGDHLTEHGVKPSAEKVRAIVEMAVPTCKEDIQRMLGTVNYVGKHIPNLSSQTVALRSLLNKKSPWCWMSNHQKEWDGLKLALMNAPVLVYFDPDLKTKVSSDASKDGLGAALLQQHGDDWLPVAYAARSMTISETRYAQIEKECLGIVFACERFDGYIFGLKSVQLETDHKPLIPMSKKDLNNLSPRIQRLMLRLQRYDFIMTWTPGKHLYLADTLSRSNSQDQVSTTESDVDAQVNMVYTALPASRKQLERIVLETDKDPILSTVKNNIVNGWRNGSCPAYQSFKDELSIIQGVIMRGSRIVVPPNMRQEMLSRIHEGHLGIEKQRRMARDVLYWPNMNVEIERVTQECDTCQKFRYSLPKETYVRDDETYGPWEKVGTDLFYWDSKNYLIVIDYYSNYPEISLLNDTTSQGVIIQMKSVFARHGIPDKVVSDNGPQFASESFTDFARTYGFDHRTSSPKYPQSNGKAEKGVQIVKRILGKAKDSGTDPYLALMQYRSAPMENGKSPAELLMNRKLKTILPRVMVDVSATDQRTESLKQRQVSNYNKGARDLPPLSENDVVRIKGDGTWSDKGKVVNRLDTRSYQVATDNGQVLRRNRKQLLATKEKCVDSDNDSVVEVTEQNVQLEHASIPEQTESKQINLRRSYRVRNEPDRYSPTF